MKILNQQQVHSLAVFTIGVRLLTVRPPGEVISVSILPDSVGVKVTEISRPSVACSLQMKACVLGAQIARVLGRRSRTPKLLSAELLHPAIMQRGIA